MLTPEHVAEIEAVVARVTKSRHVEMQPEMVRLLGHV